MPRRPRDRTALAALLIVAAIEPALALEEVPPADIPKLQREGASPEAFAPAGWTVEAKATGDLDGDGKPDAAFVLHGADPRLVLDNKDGIGPDALDTNPRIFAVAIATRAGYRLVAQNATLIPRRDQPNIDDAFSADDGLSIARGAVKVKISLFASAGGWGMSNVDFTFALKGGALRLIGYDRDDTQRNTGETKTVSINYASGRMSVATGRIDEEPDERKTLWRKAPTAQGPTLDAIGDGLEFDPTAK